jgi:uncharacterized RDD family membrane protein YckC
MQQDQQTIPCSLLKRIAIIFYDLVLLFGMLLLASFATLPFLGGEAVRSFNPFLTLYFIGVTYLFYAWFWTHGGQTLGMKTWRVRVETLDGQAISYQQALVRATVAIISTGLFGLGFLWSLFDKEKRTWHDIASNSRLTAVVKKKPS